MKKLTLKCKSYRAFDKECADRCLENPTSRRCCVGCPELSQCGNICPMLIDNPGSQVKGQVMKMFAIKNLVIIKEVK